MFSEARLAIANNRLTEEELQRTSSLLLDRQFLYRDEPMDKEAYFIVEDNVSLFSNLAEMLGAELLVRHEFGLIGFLPRRQWGRLSLTQTAALLVLRLVYDEEMRAGNVTDNRVTVPGTQFVHAYNGLTGRHDVDKNRKTFDDLLRPLVRKGILKMSREVDDEYGYPYITIKPAIELVVTKAFANDIVQRIAEQSGVVQDIDEEIDELNQVDGEGEQE